MSVRIHYKICHHSGYDTILFPYDRLEFATPQGYAEENKQIYINIVAELRNGTMW